MMIGLPTLVGQQVRNNPTMGYTRATAKVISDMTKTMMEIMSTGFGIEKGGRARDYRLLSPSLERNSSMSTMDRAAYNRFVADGLIDITAAYDQSGLASAPTEQYSSLPNKSMQVLSYMFHHAERVNREIMSMAAFRSAMDRRANYKNKQQAFAESIAEAKDVTARSMFDYSSANKPRYFQHPVAGVILQFKQFPQQMTFFLARNAYNAIFNGKLSIEEKREARARFAGTMGTAAIMSGITGVWGFSTVAAITEAVFNGLGGDDGEEPFDFELEFVNYLVKNLGVNAGMFLARGAGNAIGFDLASKLKLDGMWIPDMRKNLDGEAMLTETIVKALGPTVGLAVNVPRAWKQWNEGHGDRAIETISPAFVKQPMIAYRYAKEGGAKTLAGDYMVKDFTPFELFMQSLGIRSAELAEIQEFNIKKKGQEQAIVKERQQILNLFALSFMSGDAETNKQSFENIMKFNAKHPTKAFDADGLISSIQKRMEKSAQTEYGLYIDPKLQQLVNEDYIRMLARKPKGDKPSSAPKEWWEDAPLSK
jgi:TfoX/Sxy family transcriptional regulator of competence genes